MKLNSRKTFHCTATQKKKLCTIPTKQRSLYHDIACLVFFLIKQKQFNSSIATTLTTFYQILLTTDLTEVHRLKKVKVFQIPAQ